MGGNFQMKRKLIVLTMVIIFVLSGCSSEKTVSQVDYNKLKTELDVANSKNKELETEIAKLKDKVSLLETEEKAHLEENTPTKISVEEEMTNEELEIKLKEQPVFVVSTDYLIQDDEHKALYPDMLNAVIKNNSGKEIKNAKVAFVAWDKNNLPVKIIGQFDFGGGSYIREVDFGDVNMVDGDTFGEDKGLSLDDNTDNIATIKAIVTEYTDFDGNMWSNPYYKTWKSIFENRKLNE